MRIASKRLRYTMELFQDLYSLHTAHGKEFTAAIGEVESIQKHLGEIHDADVLVPELLAYLAGSLRAGFGTDSDGDLVTGVHHVDLDGCRGLLTLCEETRNSRDARFARLVRD